MQNNDRLQRALRLRQLGGGAALAGGNDIAARSSVVDDLKLFGMTFAAGFLFTTIFLA